eukprot:4916529-Amphidinium_carterae.1
MTAHGEKCMVVRKVQSRQGKATKVILQLRVGQSSKCQISAEVPGAVDCMVAILEQYKAGKIDVGS